MNFKAMPVLARAVASLAVASSMALAADPAPAQVGWTQLQVDGRPLTLVYPTDRAARPTAVGPFRLEVAVDALLADGPPRRLILMSHGTGGHPSPDHALASRLARAGFIVAQPLHAGDHAADPSQAGPASWRARPAEISRALDALAADPMWGPRLRLDRVGLHGMSAGGVTAIALAGGQWNTLMLVRHCQQHLEADLGFCFNGIVDPAAQAERRAVYERSRGVPEALLPAALTAWQGGRSIDDTEAHGGDPRPDPRIASVTVSVPVAAIFSPASLARIRVPIGVVGAEADEMLLPKYHSRYLLQHCRLCVDLGDLPLAGHFDLLEPWPEPIARAAAAAQPRGARPNPSFDAAQRSWAFDRIAEFHRRHLDQD
jgi:predicted dienelactone hydrolase